MDEKTRLKKWTESARARIEAGNYTEGYAGFVRWVRDEYDGAAGLAGGELVGERAAVEAWLMIEWDRRLFRWERDDKLGINAAGFGVWDDEDYQEEKDKEKIVDEGSSKSN
uniref:Uncharacterized protein n=1 Tax=Leersia perrieri TaxID=77586 RepID=A0A0D9XU45_9ORYZ